MRQWEKVVMQDTFLSKIDVPLLRRRQEISILEVSGSQWILDCMVAASQEVCFFILFTDSFLELTT